MAWRYLSCPFHSYLLRILRPIHRSKLSSAIRHFRDVTPPPLLTVTEITQRQATAAPPPFSCARVYAVDPLQFEVPTPCEFQNPVLITMSDLTLSCIQVFNTNAWMAFILLVTWLFRWGSDIASFLFICDNWINCHAQSHCLIDLHCQLKDLEYQLGARIQWTLLRLHNIEFQIILSPK